MTKASRVLTLAVSLGPHDMPVMQKRQLVRIINQNFSLVQLLVAAGVRVHEGDDEEVMFCPFHPNVNTPAAKRYRDNRIFCYAERRQFGPYDVLTQLLGYKDEELLDIVVKEGLAEAEQFRQHINYLTLANLEKKSLFVRGMVDLSIYLEEVLDTYELLVEKES